MLNLMLNSTLNWLITKINNPNKLHNCFIPTSILSTGDKMFFQIKFYKIVFKSSPISSLQHHCRKI